MIKSNRWDFHIANCSQMIYVPDCIICRLCGYTEEFDCDQNIHHQLTVTGDCIKCKR